AARHAGPPTMMVTSVPGTLPGNIGNLLLSPGEAHMAEHRAIENPANGPGDLMAALLLAWILLGIAPAEALRRATAATYETLARAAGRGADELMLETDAASLASPAAMVKTSRFSMPDSPERA
ncbi:pyridoxal kinase, partial [Nitratireductor sp. GCM10026969]